MVRIRMQRVGRPHLPMYRINAVDKRVKRDGAVLENLGWYNPTTKDLSKQLMLKTDRVKHWLSLGAQPSDTVMDMLIKAELIDGTEWKKKHEATIAAKKAAAEKKAANPEPVKKDAKKA